MRLARANSSRDSGLDIKSLLALGPLLAATACNPTYYTKAAVPSCSPDKQPPVAELRAAAMEVDITPPIGLSLHGHGLEGRVSTGLLTHLYCRGFYFTLGEKRLAWIACDLQAISPMLQLRVAELTRARTSTGIGVDRLLLSATHTHAGPSHFYDSPAYSSAVGGAREPGYDQRVVDFIADRIANGIKDAETRLAPARVTSTVVKCIPGINRNRALPAFLRNPESNEPPCGGPTTRLDPAHEAVNRDLTVLKIDGNVGEGAARAWAPLGVMAVFAVHPTAIASRNELYHGDLVAFAARYCQDELAKKRPYSPAPHPKHPPVCAIANGAEGDVSPDWGVQGEREARRIGERLGLHLVLAFDDLARSPEGPDEPLLDVRYRELALPRAPIPGPTAGAAPRALCPEAEIGAPVAGGAPDGPIRLRIFEQMNAGIIHPDRVGCAAPRVTVMPFVPTTLEATHDGFFFPVRVPIEWFRIGHQAFIALPGEPTTIAGRRIASAAHAGLKPADRVESTTLVGLTNAYLQYFATREEYQAQQYEGASTLYGPATVEFFERYAKELAAKTDIDSPGECKAVSPPDLATDEKPVGDTERGTNPHRPKPGEPVEQPKPGKVSDLHFTPDPLLSRWPGDLPVDKACPPRAEIDARAIAAGFARARLFKIESKWTEHENGVRVLSATWRDRSSLALCGGPNATLLWSRCGDNPRRWGVLRLSRKAASPAMLSDSEMPGGVRAEPLPPGSAPLTLSWRDAFPVLCDDPTAPPIDDINARVSLAYDFRNDAWTARTALTASSTTPPDADSMCLALAVRDGSGELRIVDGGPVPPLRSP